MSEASAKKNVQKLQRAIVHGLQDVKAQDIRVFNTEHMSPLFERVIVASGTSNRQTKALASSVRDKVRESGFAKPRVEGEDNGEWIIVDCGPAVAHIMQPAIRQYYNLEEIWGEKPVHLRGSGTAPARKGADSKPKAPPGTATVPAAAKKVVRKKPAAAAQLTKQATGAKAPTAKKVATKKTATKKLVATKATARSAPAGKSSAGRAGTARPALVRGKAPGAVRPVAGKTKSPAAKPVAKKVATRKAPSRSRG